MLVSQNGNSHQQSSMLSQPFRILVLDCNCLYHRARTTLKTATLTLSQRRDDAGTLTMATQKTLLIIDDDAKIRQLLQNIVTSDGFLVVEAPDGANALREHAARPFDLITLDLTLPDISGLDLARQLREQRDTPIIMITGKGDTIDRVLGLEIGADDYIVKPFHVREVLARIHSVLRRIPSPDKAGPPVKGRAIGNAMYEFNDWTFDIDARELRHAVTGPCPLTTTEFELLKIFIERPNRPLSRDQIMDLTKGHDWAPNDRTIDNQVARLRKKIESNSASPRLIKTVRGLGYSFCMPKPTPSA